MQSSSFKTGTFGRHITYDVLIVIPRNSYAIFIQKHLFTVEAANNSIICICCICAVVIVLVAKLAKTLFDLDLPLRNEP